MEISNVAELHGLKLLKESTDLDQMTWILWKLLGLLLEADRSLSSCYDEFTKYIKLKGG